MTFDGPAEAFTPGEFLKDELDGRLWTQTDLAEILGRPVRVVNEIIAGKRAITPETAKGLGDAFGTSAEFWMNLESSYQLWKLRDKDDRVKRRARLYELAPVNDMMRRSWITRTKDIDALEAELLRFLEIPNIYEAPEPVAHAARKSTDELTREQDAWIRRVRHLAPVLRAQRFTDDSVDRATERLRPLASAPENISLIPEILAHCGIRFLVVEHLPRTRIDGVCVWVENAPVIALSVRYDRIDYFWHTLMHELGHVKSRDGLTKLPTLDTDINGGQATPDGQRPSSERAADDFAATSLITEDALSRFIEANGPLYSAAKIQAGASEMGVHPGILVGQLQYKSELSYATLRRYLVSVRQVIASAAHTDGWGVVSRH